MVTQNDIKGDNLPKELNFLSLLTEILMDG